MQVAKTLQSDITMPEHADVPAGRPTDVAAPRRILVAEDDPVSHDVLKTLFASRGHHVDVVTDGEQALDALKTEGYDVVLVDFHLPKLDGLEVAAAFRSTMTGAGGPRFVAITADMRGLLEHASTCSSFDEVVAKPFDLDDVCKIVEDDYSEAADSFEPMVGEAPEDEARANRQPTDNGQPTATDELPVPASGTSKAFGLEFEFLCWPEDFDGDRLSARAMRASLGDGAFHAILINQPATVNDLRAIWKTKFLHCLPVVDRGGTLGRAADFDASKFGFRDAGKIDELIRGFENRRSLLHRDFIYTEDAGRKLLARVFLGGGDLTAGHDPTSRRFVDYNCMAECDIVEREAGKLVEDGLLKRSFFDRLHMCDRCGSSRFNIREECSECRSPNLTEEPYLHHFRCAYQGLESDFRQDDALICPKCRRELTHFSVDYDKPGNMIQCNACGHKGSDPAVGLLCMDCGAHTDGDRANAVDVFSYELTERALAQLESGCEGFAATGKPLHFAELPLELIVAINGQLSRFKNDGIPFTLLDISYRNARALEIEHGARQFDQARNLFLENLRNLVRKTDRVIKGRFYDFVLLTQTEAGQTRDHLDDIHREATNAVRLDLGVVITAHGVESFV